MANSGSAELTALRPNSPETTVKLLADGLASGLDIRKMLEIIEQHELRLEFGI
jgi:hypothetical protein